MTLRAWERRYGLIRPQRTPKGHRLYSRADIQRIEQVLALLDRGIAIGQARAALDAQQQGSENPAPATLPRERSPRTDDIDRMIEAIGAFDEKTLNTIYNEALSLYPVELVTSQMIVPLLEELGRRWESREGSVAEEHFFSVFLRNKLGARFHHMALDTHGPRLLCACLPTESHELALPLFCLAALTRNYRIVLLGANMPFADLPLAARRSDSNAIVLAGSVGAYWPALEAELGLLVRRVRIPVFVGVIFPPCIATPSFAPAPLRWAATSLRRCVAWVRSSRRKTSRAGFPRRSVQAARSDARRRNATV